MQQILQEFDMAAARHLEIGNAGPAETEPLPTCNVSEEKPSENKADLPTLHTPITSQTTESHPSLSNDNLDLLLHHLHPRTF
jgi:hypothetical protein